LREKYRERGWAGQMVREYIDRKETTKFAIQLARWAEHESHLSESDETGDRVVGNR